MIPFLTVSPMLLHALLAAGCAALAALGMLALGRARKRAQQEQIGQLHETLTALRSEYGAQTATLLALAARFDALQQQISADARHAAPAPSAATGSAFELGIRLARSGATADELMSACMMSRHEAELALRLHGSRSRAATPPTHGAAVARMAVVASSSASGGR